MTKLLAIRYTLDPQALSSHAYLQRGLLEIYQESKHSRISWCLCRFQYASVTVPTDLGMTLLPVTSRGSKLLTPLLIRLSMEDCNLT